VRVRDRTISYGSAVISTLEKDTGGSALQKSTSYKLAVFWTLNKA